MTPPSVDSPEAKEGCGFLFWLLGFAIIGFAIYGFFAASKELFGG